MQRRTVDLLDLLAARSMGHPSRLQSAELRGDTLVLSLEGWSWWRETRPAIEGQIQFRFEGISRGAIDISDLIDPDGDEVLDVFQLQSTATLAWAQPPVSIFCNGPVPRPLEIYTRVQNYLLDADALRTPADVLNGGHKLSWFLEVAASPVHHLAHAPPVIADLIVDVLNDQGVPHTVSSQSTVKEAPLLVRIGDHGFFCERATAEFDLD